MEKVFKVEGMHCMHCSARIEKALSELGYTVSVSLENSEVKVSRQEVSVAEVENVIEELGFIVK